MAARVKSSGVPAMPLMSRTVHAKSTATPPHSRQQAQRGITGALQGVSPGCPRTLLALSPHGRSLPFHSVRFVGRNYLRSEFHGAITLARGQ